MSSMLAENRILEPERDSVGHDFSYKHTAFISQNQGQNMANVN